jgi:hypothetical protein
MAYRIQARVGVQAPAFAVWEIISALDTWQHWNPLFTEAEGRLSIGALLQLRRVHEGKRELHEVRVVDWVPNEQILWTRSLGLMATVMAYMEIEALSETACVLSVGEIYDGLIGERIGEKKRRILTPGWKALADAAKQRAEAAWDGTPGESLPPPPPSKKKSAARKMQLEQMGILGRRKPMA